MCVFTGDYSNVITEVDFSTAVTFNWVDKKLTTELGGRKLF
jgi:hypothetical protein